MLHKREKNKKICYFVLDIKSVIMYRMFEEFSVTYPVFELLVAMLLGAFLGIRREIQAHLSIKNRSFMGIRTMTLLCGLGALSTFFKSFPSLPIIFFLCIMALLVTAYAHGSFKMNRIGITTELSAIITFWIGVLVGEGQAIMAIFLTILLAILNAFKDKLHGFVKTLNLEEWTGALQLMAFSGAVLPFLPQDPIDPWGVIVPFNVWLLVILISGIGFSGYFLIKYFGARGGIPLTGFFGALISSTAVTTSLAAQSKNSKYTRLFVVGILVGLATMQVRVAFEILLLGNAKMISGLIAVPLSMALAGGIAAYYHFRNADKIYFWETKPEIKLKSPFEIKPALQFGAIFILVLLAVVLGKKYFGDSGVYAAATLSGIIDVDAIVLSTLESTKLGELDFIVAKNSIALAIFTNTIIKIGYVALLGTRELLRIIAVTITLISGVGIITFFFS